MREIKFRAWDGKKMHDKVTLDDEGRGIKHGYQWFSEGNTLLHSPVMQYTGLKDKNGNDVYESDIVEYISKHDNKYIGEIKWSPFNNMAGFQTSSPYINIFDSASIEVIGNIYESAHLLDNIS